MDLDQKPFASSCAENQDPILEILAPVLARASRVLEIGSGTGQHAVYFAAAMPHLRWQCSDVAEYLPGISAWLDEAALPNLPAPIELDVDTAWPDGSFDAAYSANTAHIMSLPQVKQMFTAIGCLLSAGAPFALYGPFSEDGRHTSASNAQFDRYLRQHDPLSGVRDLIDLRRFADAAGLSLEDDRPMPVNNRTLIWRKRG